MSEILFNVFKMNKNNKKSKSIFLITCSLLLSIIITDVTAQQKSPEEYKNEAIYAYSNSDEETSIKAFKQAINGYELRGEKEKAIDLWITLGYWWHLWGKLDKADEFFQVAKAQLVEFKYDSLSVRFYWRYTKFLIDSKKLVQARENADQLLVLSTKLDNQSMVVTAHNLLAIIYRLSHIYDKAIEHNRIAYQYRSTQNDYKNVSVLWTNLGLIYSDMGYYAQALAAFNRANEIYREHEVSELQTMMFHMNIGSTYNKLNRNDLAKIHISDSKELAQAKGYLMYYVNISLKMVAQYIYKSQFAEASNLLEECQKIIKENNYMGSQIYLDILRANFETKQGNFKLAIDILNELIVLDKENNLGFNSDILVELASVYLQNEEYEKGNIILSQIPDYTYFNPSKISENFAIISLRLNLEGYLNPEKGYLLFEEFKPKIDYLYHSATGSSQTEASILSEFSNLYRIAAFWAVESGILNNNEAYNLILESKSRVLLNDKKAKRAVDKNEEINKSLKRYDLEGELNQAYAKLVSTSDVAEIKKIKSNITNLELKYDVEFINNNEEIKFDFKTSEELQSFLKEDELLLDYSVLENGILIFQVTSTEIRSLFVPIKNDLLNQYVEEWLEKLNDLTTPYQVSNILAIRLSNLLIGNAPLPDYAKLIIIADKQLSYLPFDALPVKGRYLVESHVTNYLPTPLLLSIKVNSNRNSDFKYQLLSVANPDLNDESNAVFRSFNLGALPFTQMEVDSIKTFFNSSKVVSFVGEAANKENILEQDWSQFQYLHFATHGIINKEYPYLSGLLLAGNQNDLTGYTSFLLTTSDILKKDITAEMVVLSGCETGVGKLIEGEGFLGLQRSFIISGASRIVTSLWNINDRSTSLFMSRFYASLKGNWDSSRWWEFSNKGELVDYNMALQITKKMMLSSSRYNHPYYWASFILTDSSR